MNVFTLLALSLFLLLPALLAQRALPEANLNAQDGLGSNPSSRNNLFDSDESILFSEDGGKNVILLKENSQKSNFGGKASGMGANGQFRSKRGHILRGMALGAVAGGTAAAIAGK